MKSSLWRFILILAGIVLTMLYAACDRSVKEVVATENGSEAIWLISENGTVVAESVEELKRKILPAVKNKFGEKVDFIITDVKFLETQNQTAAFVSYMTDMGEASNVCILRQVGQPNPEIDTVCPEYQVWCTGGCQEGCQVHGIMYPNGEISFSCTGCSDCVLHIRCIESGSGGS